MAEIVASKGDRVKFRDIPANREKGLAGTTGTVKHRQDFILHVEMDEPRDGSILPSGLQYPTITQVEVVTEDYH